MALIEIDGSIKERCILYACKIAVYRGYTGLVNGLQSIEDYEVNGRVQPGLRSKHDAEWLELRDAFARKSLAHQYHEASDVYYYANQLERQMGEIWLPSDLHSLRNTYGLNTDLVQRCAEAKYAWRSEAPGNKNEAYELGLIEAIIQ